MRIKKILMMITVALFTVAMFAAPCFAAKKPSLDRQLDKVTREKNNDRQVRTAKNFPKGCAK